MRTTFTAIIIFITVSVFAMCWAVARVITAVIFIMAVLGSIPDSDLIREKGRESGADGVLLYRCLGISC